MSNDQAILAAFLSTTVLGWILSIVDFIGGNAYDLRSLTKKRPRILHPTSKRFRHRPLISVIVPAHNEALAIRRCITQLFNSSYRKFEVIIVDDASTDATKKLVKDVSKLSPRRSIKLVSKRHQSGKAMAALAGFQKHASGELILVLDADTLVDRTALRAIANHFTDEGTELGLLNVQVVEHPSVIGLMQRFDYIKANQTRKVNSLFNSEVYLGSRISGTVYRRSVFRRIIKLQHSAQSNASAVGLAMASIGNKTCRVRYIHDAVLFTEPLTSLANLISQRSRWVLGDWQVFSTSLKQIFGKGRSQTTKLAKLRLPLSAWQQVATIIELFVIAYFMYLAIFLQQPAMYFILWAAASFILLFNILISSQMSVKSRLNLIPYTPLMFHLLLVMRLIEVLSILKSVIKAKVVHSSQPAVWQTPKRLADQI